MANAPSLRVIQAAQTVERPVDPEIGWWVAAWDGTQPARIELLDDVRAVLHEQEFGARAPS